MRLLAFGLSAMWAAAPTLFGADTGRRHAPQINAGGVVNAAGFRPAPENYLAPGTIVSIFGADLALQTHAVGEGDLDRGRLPLRLAGVSVLAAGVPAAMLFVSPQQINAQLPAVLPQGRVKLQVVRESLASPEVEVEVRPAAPGLFPLVLHEDFTFVGRGQPEGAVPARPGDAVVLLGSGFGPTSPFLFEGELPPWPAQVVLPSKVILGNRELSPPDVLYVGAAPHFAGVYQVNFRLPAGLRLGDYEVFVEIDGVRSQPGVFVAVEE